MACSMKSQFPDGMLCKGLLRDLPLMQKKKQNNCFEQNIYFQNEYDAYCNKHGHFRLPGVQRF